MTATECAPGRGSTILFVSDNGHGLGHVTRLMAIARRLPPGVDPVFLTLSEAHATVSEQGFPVEYFPSGPRLKLVKTDWSALFSVRLSTALDRFQPRVVVVDHIAPSVAFREARSSHPEVRLVWSRRGLWRPGANEGAAEIRPWFHHVFEPGDVADDHDAGFTATDRRGVVRVPPITLLDRAELLERGRARRELGLPARGPCVLVALSDDRPEALAELIAIVRRAADRVAPDIHLFAPRHPLHGNRLEEVGGVTMRPTYPVARYLAAFDAAIVGAGYNTVHEVVRAGVPAIFVPKDTESVDDQAARAQGAVARGAGWLLEDLASPHFETALRGALDGERGSLEDADVTTNGAAQVAGWLAELAATPVTVEVPASARSAPDPVVLERARTRFLTGQGGVDRRGPRQLLDATRLSDADLRYAAKSIATAQRAGQQLRPVLLVSAGADTSGLSRRSLVYETALSSCGDAYLGRRRDELQQLWAPAGPAQVLRARRDVDALVAENERTRLAPLAAHVRSWRRWLRR